MRKKYMKKYIILISSEGQSLVTRVTLNPIELNHGKPLKVPVSNFIGIQAANEVTM